MNNTKKRLAVLLALFLLLPIMAAAEELATPTDLECKHEWIMVDGRSVCYLCGIDNPCTADHEENYVVSIALYPESKVHYKEEDDCWHAVIGRGYVIKTCPECGMFLGRQDNMEVWVSDFHQYDENHVCTLCGHVCAHKLLSGGICIYCGYNPDSEIIEAVKAMLVIDAEAEIIANEDGTKTVLLFPDIKKAKGPVSLTANAETLEKLTDSGVSEINIKTDENGISLDVKAMQEQLGEREDATLIIELEQDPAEELLLIRRVFLKDGDTETELEEDDVLKKEEEE